MTHYTFVQCTGPIEGGNGDTAHVNYKTQRDAMYFNNGWYWVNSEMAVDPSDWPHIEVLKEVEGVVMSREQVGELWDEALEWADFESSPRVRAGIRKNHIPDKETTINNMFK